MKKLTKALLALFAIAVLVAFVKVDAFAAKTATMVQEAIDGSMDYREGSGDITASYKRNYTDYIQYTHLYLSQKSMVQMNVIQTSESTVYIYNDLNKLKTDANAGSPNSNNYIYSGSNGSNSTNYWELPSGDYYFYEYKSYGTNNVSIQYRIAWIHSETNTSFATAEERVFAFNETATKEAPTGIMITFRDGCGSNGSLYYKFTVTDKAWFRLQGNSPSFSYGAFLTSNNTYQIKFYKSTDTSEPIASFSGDKEYGFTALDKGTYYAVVNCRAFSFDYGLYMQTYDFKEIKSLTIPTHTGAVGENITFKYTGSPSDYESYIDFNGTKLERGKTLTFQYLYPGTYTLSIKTSEGLVAPMKVNVTPNKMDYKYVKSVGTHNSTTIQWNTPQWSGYIGSNYYPNTKNANYYRIYQYKGGKYVKVWQGAAGAGDINAINKAKITKLSANKTYSFKIAACWKNSDGTIIEGPKSGVFKAVTAPSKKPTLKKASGTGTKYHKGTKTWINGYHDGNGIWHDGYCHKTPAYSMATVKYSIGKVSGASGYQGYANKQSVNISNSKASFKYTGKIKAKSVKTRIRSYKKNKTYNSVAYGPWTSYKSVRLKAAK